MRLLVFLAAVFLITLVVFAQSPFLSAPAAAQQHITPGASRDNSQRSQPGDGVRMWRRAQIVVNPLDVMVANRAELSSLRTRAARIEADSALVNPSDPAVREQLEKQLQLINSLLSFAERTQSDSGKGPAALEVQRHLNDIEGKVNCEACHTGVVAQAASK